MEELDKKPELRIKTYRGYLVSVVLHVAVIWGSVYLYSGELYKPPQTREYIDVYTPPVQNEQPEVDQQPQPEETTPQPETVDETEETPGTGPTEDTPPPTPPASTSIKSDLQNADTSSLNQVYKESTLDVKIRYPLGWTYIDQNVKNTLDGVTFISVAASPENRPYIHLEVKEKYLFNPSRYKYKQQMDDYMAYYNDPEEMEGQVSFLVYMVTDTDEDYSIKLIVNGMENFKEYKPTFFAMLKTFSFGGKLL